MSRRFWSGLAFVVSALIGGMFAARYVRAEAAPDRPSLVSESVAQANPFALLALGGIFVLGFGYLLFKAARYAVRWLTRTADWAWQNRPPTRRERSEAEALQAALDANKNRNIARSVGSTVAEHEAFLDIVTEFRKGIRS